MHGFDEGLTLSAKTRRDSAQDELDRMAGELFGLFQTREKEFGFNPAIHVEYPEVMEHAASPFLSDPIGYIAERVADHEQAGRRIVRVVLLTTFADTLEAPLIADGYKSTWIDMPAGPDFTCSFERAIRTGDGDTLYLEAVNEADEKIRPSFALELRDSEGRLRGGACGSIHERDGVRFCYLATMTLDSGLPPSTGSKLGHALIEFLRTEGVRTIHLGTQTAGPFYQKLGFHVTHRVLRDLRSRRTGNGAAISTDLVMMERTI